MLQFENISLYMSARARLGKNHYWGRPNTTKESDTLLAFTTELDARNESRANLSALMEKSKSVGAEIVIVNPTLMQVVGTTTLYTPREIFGNEFFKRLKEYGDAHDKSSAWWLPKDNDAQKSDLGFCTTSLRIYGHGMWATPEDQGFYNVHTGKKITNRVAQIEALWDLGFASRRGRPMHVAQEKWSGSRGELEELTSMAAALWDRRHTSDAAKKIVSAYRSINRYVAWPGSL